MHNVLCCRGVLSTSKHSKQHQIPSTFQAFQATPYSKQYVCMCVFMCVRQVGNDLVDAASGSGGVAPEPSEPLGDAADLVVANDRCLSATMLQQSEANSGLPESRDSQPEIKEAAREASSNQITVKLHAIIQSEGNALHILFDLI